MSEGYTLKEMIREMRETQKEDSARLIRTLEHTANVDKHLDELNSKVATNAKDIDKLEQFKTKAMVIWSLVVFVVVSVLNKFI